jgi:hypothetical protein
MRPTNILLADEFLVKVNSDHNLLLENIDLKEFKVNSINRVFRSEKRNATLGAVMNHEHNYFSNNPAKITDAIADHEQDQNYSFYDHMDDNLNYKIEKEHQVETKYAWAHLSCANFINEIEYTPKSPLKIGKLNAERFFKPCIICCQTNGAGIRCAQDDCDIWMHGECSRRAGYYMECGKPEAIQDNEGNDVPTNTISTVGKDSNCKGKGSSLVIKNKNMLKIF